MNRVNPFSVLCRPLLLGAFASALVLTLLLCGRSASIEASPECDSQTLRRSQVVVTVSDLATTSLDQVLPAVEDLQTCGVLDVISAEIDQSYSRRHDLRTAILMVQTLANGPVDMEDTSVHNAIKLMAFRIAKLTSADQEVLLGYAARKLATDERTEALLALVRGGIPQHVEDQILAGVTTSPVKRGPWAPPGGQPIPFYIGNEAHKQIAAHYVAAHTGEAVRVNSTPISALLIELAERGVGPAENLGATAVGAQAMRPDIVNLTTGEIYEIKPAGAETAAQLLVSGHVATFAKAGVTMKPGRSWAPGTDGVVPGPAGHYVFYGYAPGVIVYRYQRGDYVPVPVPVPEKAGAPSQKLVPVPVHEPEHALARPKRQPSGFWARMEELTGLTGAALGVYVVISEGSRVLLPPRNAIPIP